MTTDKYDILLAAIPILLAKGGIISYLSDIPIENGIAIGGSIALVLLFWGMFIEPPRPKLAAAHQ